MPDGAPSVETVREQLELILASSGFRASESLRRLLRYTVEAALAGRGDSLKEYTLGVEALGRAESFDPRQDTIVRVQARKLRERLAAYYAAEGSGEPYRIVYRPGSYVPAFTGAHEAAANPTGSCTGRAATCRLLQPRTRQSPNRRERSPSCH